MNSTDYYGLVVVRNRVEAAKTAKDFVIVKRMTCREALGEYDAIATRQNYADAHIRILRKLGIVEKGVSEMADSLP